MIQLSTLKFLKELKKNNNKPWFDANRKQYELAKTDFTEFVTKLLAAIAKNDPSIATQTAKDCTFRINRDVRFSKNKDPYKTNMGAGISKGGKKMNVAGYYFHCEPGGNSFIGGGLYMAEADQLKKIRQEIDYNWPEFQKMVESKKFKSVFGSLSREEGLFLTREPKGYEKDNPAIEYIKLKSFTAVTPLTDADLTNKDLVKKTAAVFATLQPLIAFLNRGLEG
ncbi:MAG: DUF2461 domain-containing protein [Chitinophagaceae bacterium]|nr:DUF2461 domain-containing protein [Chitinophagaceae bacterium]